jgi:hypothetical protein
MDAEELAQAVRQQLGLGRLLPLGDADDGAWLAERAAVDALRAAVTRALPQVRPEKLRLAADTSPDAEPAQAPAVPPPPSALPPGPLRIEAQLAAPPHTPLPTLAERLREALLVAADRELGLRVTAVDLRFTDLLDGTDGGGSRTDGHAEALPAPADEPRGTATAQAVIAVPGVARLAPVLGSPLGGRSAEAVSVTDRAGPDGRTRRHVSVQLATAEGARALDVARAARRAAAKAAAWDAEEPDTPVTVAVLVTAVDAANGAAEQGG